MTATKTIIAGTITTSKIAIKTSTKTVTMIGIATAIITGGMVIATGTTIAGGRVNANERENTSAGNAITAMTATTAVRSTTALLAVILVAAILVAAIPVVATPAADMATPAQFTDGADTAMGQAVSASTKAVWRVRTRRAKTSRKASPSTRIPEAPTTPTTDITATWETRTSIGLRTPRATVHDMSRTSAAAVGAAGVSRKNVGASVLARAGSGNLFARMTSQH